MKLQILMATMLKSDIEDINWEEKNIVSDVLLINQTNFENISEFENIKMISTQERGLAKSRNLAINNATGDICLISDDDAIYVPGYEQIILSAFRKYPEADIITFQIKTPDGSKFNPYYPLIELEHNWRTSLRCASLEIAFKKESIKKTGLQYDVLFGLGAKYKMDDEIIFLNDALKKKLKLIYIPVPIVIHPVESSGTKFNYDLAYSKGAAFARMFGKRGYIFDFLFALKKRSFYKYDFSFYSFLRLMFLSTTEYLRKNKI